MSHLKDVGRDDIGGKKKERRAVVLRVADDVLQRVGQRPVHHVPDAIREARILKPDVQQPFRKDLNSIEARTQEVKRLQNLKPQDPIQLPKEILGGNKMTCLANYFPRQAVCVDSAHDEDFNREKTMSPCHAA